MGKNSKHRRPSYVCACRSFKAMGFVLLVFGVITLCAFFLPIKAWIVLLGIVFIVCGAQLLR